MTVRRREKKPKTTSPVGKFYAKIAEAAFNNGWKGVQKDINTRLWTVLRGEYAGTWMFEQKVDGPSRQIRISYRADVANYLYGVSIKTTRADDSWNEGIANLIHTRQLLVDEMWKEQPHLTQTGTRQECNGRTQHTVDIDYKMGLVDQGFGLPVMRMAGPLQEHKVRFIDFVGVEFQEPMYMGNNMRVMLEQASVNFEEWATHDHALDSLKQAAKIWVKFHSHKDRVAYAKKFFACHSPYAALPSWVKRIAKWKVCVGELGRLDQIRYMPKHWHQNYTLQGVGGDWGEIAYAVEDFARNKVRWTLTRKILASGCTFEVWDWATVNRDDLLGEMGRRVRHALDTENFSGLIRYHDELAAAEQERQRNAEDEATKLRRATAEKWHKECPWPSIADNYSFVVEVLRTPEEIRQEGDRQEHCVGSYVFLTHCYLLSLAHEDGTRTTAQVSPRFKVLQHLGVRNCTPSVLAKRNLQKYLVVAMTTKQ